MQILFDSAMICACVLLLVCINGQEARHVHAIVKNISISTKNQLLILRLFPRLVNEPVN